MAGVLGSPKGRLSASRGRAGQGPVGSGPGGRWGWWEVTAP